MTLRTSILFERVTDLIGLAQVLDQNNAVLARANDVEMKDAPRSINDPRLHGRTKAAQREHPLGIGNSWRNDGYSRSFRLFPLHITDADKVTTRDPKVFDLHVVLAA